MGRTQLQDAVPMTLGQEFGTYAVTIGEDRLRLAELVLRSAARAAGVNRVTLYVAKR